MLRVKHILPALLICGAGAATLASCDDDKEYTSRGDLFMPRLFDLDANTDGAALIKGNTLRLKWYKVTDAVSYTVEVCSDNNYSRVVVAYEVTEPEVEVRDIPYGTQYFIRIRSNAADPIHNSAWATTDAKTEARPPFASIVKEISEVGDEGATVTWEIDPANPVDSISATPMANDTLKKVSRYLTATEIAAGKATFTGLDKNTLYAVDLYDTSKPGKYDKPYNQLTFRTTGPAVPPIEISRFDDLSAILNANNGDPAIPEGVEYRLPAGSYYQVRPFGLQKAFKLVGEEGDEPVQIEMGGNWDIAAAKSATAKMVINAVEFRNIEFLQTIDASYFFNNSCDFDIQQFSFINCKFIHFRRGFWRQKDVKNRHIRKILMDGCILDECHGFKGSYGTFNFEQDGNSVDTLLIQNSTFMREVNNAGNLCNYARTYSKIHLEIRNVTFYQYCAMQKTRMIDLNNVGVGSKLIIENVLFASNNGGVYRASGNTEVTLNNNYVTTEFEPGLKNNVNLDGSEEARLGISADELFVDGPNGNLTIKDPNSIIVKNRVGDPRWLP